MKWMNASDTNYGQFLLFAGSTKSTAILYEHFKHLKLNNFRNKLYLSMKISVYKKISYCLWKFLSMNCPSMNCPVYENFCLWIVRLWIVLSMKCPVYELSCLWIVPSMNCLSMNCPSMKCPSMKCPNAIKTVCLST